VIGSWAEIGRKAKETKQHARTNNDRTPRRNNDDVGCLTRMAAGCSVALSLRRFISIRLRCPTNFSLWN